MQEQFTVRVYDSKLADKLVEVFKANKDVYPTRNHFLVDCLKRGLKTIEQDLSGQKRLENFNELFEEIHSTADRLNNLIKLSEKNTKELVANLTVNQKLISCNYNMLLGLSNNAPKSKQLVENGMYDELPERLEEFLEDILKVVLKSK